MKTTIYLALFALGLSCNAAYAAHADEISSPITNDINVTLPDQQGTWSFAGTVVLLQPSSDFYQRPYLSDDTIKGNHINTKNYNVDQTYHWWFGVDLAYAFPGNGRDVTLAYEGFHATDSDSTRLPQPFGIDEATLDAKEKIENTYDAVDLLFGQKIDMGQRIRLHPFIGLRYAHIDVNNTADYGLKISIFNNNLLINSNLKDEGVFDGIGPRFGSDAQVDLGQGFSIRGRLGLSALIGNADPTFKASITNVFLNHSYPTYYSDDKNSTNRVVPELDGRLGLNYTHPFNASTAVGIELGWQAVNYFNAVPETTVNSNISRNSNLSSIPGPINNSNFALQGPYARIQIDVS